MNVKLFLFLNKKILYKLTITQTDTIGYHLDGMVALKKAD